MLTEKNDIKLSIYSEEKCHNKEKCEEEKVCVQQQLIRQRIFILVVH